MTLRAIVLIAVVLAVAGGVGAVIVLTRFPRINDVTSDTDDPPQFVAVLPLRDGANSATYGGPRVAAMQHAGYPDIVPLDLALAPADAFAKARAAADAMGWALVAADSATGRIEATATTRWMRFKDDVVIRIRPHTGGSRVDVRSVSRIGRSDLGTNARRIREFVGRLRS